MARRVRGKLEVRLGPTERQMVALQEKLIGMRYAFNCLLSAVALRCRTPAERKDWRKMVSSRFLPELQAEAMSFSSNEARCQVFGIAKPQDLNPLITDLVRRHEFVRRAGAQHAHWTSRWRPVRDKDWMSMPIGKPLSGGTGNWWLEHGVLCVLYPELEDGIAIRGGAPAIHVLSEQEVTPTYMRIRRGERGRAARTFYALFHYFRAKPGG